MTETLTVEVRPVSGPDALHRQYHGQNEPQPAYIELGLEDGIFLADYDAGGGTPGSVRAGIDQRWTIPVLTQKAANELLAELAPVAQRVLDGSDVQWDGNNRVGRILTEDAQQAYETIAARCEGIETYDGNPMLLSVWSVDTIGDVWSAGEAGITAQTTDGELEAIESRLTEEFRDGQDLDFVVINGLTEYLRGLRADLALEG
ncbi:hypothetical protein ACIQF5_20930 [Streptomyces goshikiensis]|uniref:hypothetical protein n=1 Tax=Streptomyces goshikiensis TaxID=1942 RepID=UPI0037FBD610